MKENIKVTITVTPVRLGFIQWLRYLEFWQFFRDGRGGEYWDKKEPGSV